MNAGQLMLELIADLVARGERVSSSKQRLPTAATLGAWQPGRHPATTSRSYSWHSRRQTRL